MYRFNNKSHKLQTHKKKMDQSFITILTLDKPLTCTTMMVISSVRFSFSNHNLYDSAATAEHALRGSMYLSTYTAKNHK